MQLKESLLHQWWEKKNIDFRKIHLENSQISILDFGEYNRFENGPDFFNAKVKIDDIVWCGTIEIHIKSSDWNKHGHQFDTNYNNVILHVVQEKDEEIYNSMGEIIPTVEITPFKKTTKSHFNFIRCENLISNCNQLTIINELEHSFIDRFNRKTSLIQFHEMIYDFDYQSIYWRLLFQSFGNSINQRGFEELFIACYPYLKESRDDILPLLMGFSGFEMEDDLIQKWNYFKLKHNIQQVRVIKWKTKGFYAKSHPRLRIVQLAKLFPMMKNIDWSQMQTSDWKKVRDNIIHLNILSAEQSDLMLINAIALFYWWFANQLNDEIYREKAIDLLVAIKPENNMIVQQWKTLGIRPKNAFDSQALLELKNQKCNFTQCLKCKIGQELYKFPL